MTGIGICWTKRYRVSLFSRVHLKVSLSTCSPYGSIQKNPSSVEVGCQIDHGFLGQARFSRTNNKVLMVMTTSASRRVGDLDRLSLTGEPGCDTLLVDDKHWLVPRRAASWPV